MNPCERLDCQGTYRPDGSCDTCGYMSRTPVSATPETGIFAAKTARADDTFEGLTANVARGATTTTAGRGRTRFRQGRLGADLIEITPVPARDPVSAVLPDPKVPPSQQKCRHCGRPVGQARGEVPSFAAGFCPHDQTPFSFEPTLKPEDLVDGRYAVLGCLAYGGQGWIYLARDIRLGDTVTERWVVLKGLIDTNDTDALAASIEERRFLVEVDHPSIVKVHDFVEHPNPRTGTTVGYIVMEYLGGQALHVRRRAPLPLHEVLAYGVSVLEALSYLHDKGLIFCDLKPHNIMHVGSQIKLIDLGAMLRTGTEPRAIYSTPGFQAPEVEREKDPRPPSVASDIYALGRTLAMLCLPFEDFNTTFRHRLPEPAAMPLLASHESFYLLLCRATDADPDRRFESAETMREQLLGVLAEVVSGMDGQPCPTISTCFTAERQSFGAEPDQDVDWAAVPRALPVPLVDLADPSAKILATLSTAQPDELIQSLNALPERSPEVLLRLAEAHLAGGDQTEAEVNLAAFEQIAPRDWRSRWYGAMLALAQNRHEEAAEGFRSVRATLPGELGPQLALAAALERGGDSQTASKLYQRVLRTDTGFVSAAFGLARAMRLADDPAAGIQALDRVPRTSSQYNNAQVTAIQTHLHRAAIKDLMEAEARLRRLRLNAERYRRLTIDLLTKALGCVREQPHGNHMGTVLGHRLDERELRFGLEQAYRALAKSAGNNEERSALVDRANDIRPRTLI